MMEARTYSPPRRLHLLQLSLAFCFAMSHQVSFAQDAVRPKKDRAKILAEMKSAAQQVTLTIDKRPAERRDAPIYRYDDPARRFSDGSIWAYGKTGRPIALVTIARNNPNSWMVETTSFADKPIRVLSFTLKEPFVLKGIPNTAAPKASATLRKSQMKLIARKFKAFQMWDNDGSTDLQRYELRMTTPVLEYDDAPRGVLTGAVMLFNYGSNPELALMIEAHKDGWKCGFGRMGWAASNVTYGGEAFFEQPKLSNGRGDNRYWMTAIRATRSTNEVVAQ